MIPPHTKPPRKVQKFTLTDKLRDFRRSAGISPTVVAERIGISRQAYYAIEKSKAIPSLLIAMKLAIYLDTGVDVLFDLDWWPNEQFEQIRRRKMQAKIGFNSR